MWAIDSVLPPERFRIGSPVAESQVEAPTEDCVSTVLPSGEKASRFNGPSSCPVGPILRPLAASQTATPLREPIANREPSGDSPLLFCASWDRRRESEPVGMANVDSKKIGGLE